MGISTFALLGVAFAIETRDERRSILSAGTSRDRTLLLTVGATVLVTVLAAEIGIVERIISTVPLTLEQWSWSLRRRRDPGDRVRGAQAALDPVRDPGSGGLTMANDPGALLGLIVLIAAGFLVAVLFYESLCQRDVLVARAVRPHPPVD